MIKVNVKGKVAIIDAVRSPIGSIGGGLKTLSVKDLGVHVVSHLLKRTGIDPALVEYVSFGWVMQDPRFHNLAKIISEFSGIPSSIPGTTFHENCSSGAAAIHDIARRILLGEIEIGIGGGVESMSNVPRQLYQGRLKGQLYGDFTIKDGIMSALTDAFAGEKGELMGVLTERLVEKYDVTREEQDEIAYKSHWNSRKAWDGGYFDDYVIPVELEDRKKGTQVVEKDEGPREITIGELAKQTPYFKPDGGTITSLNSSTINDGAAAVCLMSQRKTKELKIQPLGYLYSFHNIGVPREFMGEGAFKVMPPLLEKGGLSLSDIDYFEINEAFAAVLGAAFHFLENLPKEKTNQWGSGISLGHPVGCTGARQITDMIHQLRKRDKKIGITSRCVGGGMGSGEILVLS